MKIYELERIAEENDYEFYESLEYKTITLTREISKDGFITNRITLNSNTENHVFIENGHCDEKDLKVIKAAIELAETPPEDREKEEKDKENLPDWMTRCLGEPVRDCEVEVEGDGRMIPKFRVWDKEMKYLDYDVRVTSIDKYEKVEVFDGFSSWREIEKPEYILMRSIGLKDKYGKEIYEGDILTDEGFFENDCWDYGNIEFDKEDYTYYISWTIEGVLEPITACCDYAISGNKYEGNY